MILLVEAESAGHFLVGCGTVVVCGAVPLMLFALLNGASKRAVYTIDPGRGRLLKFAAGPGEWLSLRRDCHWVHRFASMMRAYRPGAVWYIVLELGSSFALSATQSMRTDNLAACGHVRIAGCAILLGMLLLETALRPHARTRDNTIDTAVLSLQASALLLSATGYYSGEAEGALASTASIVMTVAVALLVFKGIIDAVTMLYLLISGLPDRMQDQKWEREEEQISFVAVEEATPSLHDTNPPSRTNSPTPDMTYCENYSLSHMSPKAVGVVNTSSLGRAGRLSGGASERGDHVTTPLLSAPRRLSRRLSQHDQDSAFDLDVLILTPTSSECPSGPAGPGSASVLTPRSCIPRSRVSSASLVPYEEPQRDFRTWATGGGLVGAEGRETVGEVVVPAAVKVKGGELKRI